MHLSALFCRDGNLVCWNLEIIASGGWIILKSVDSNYKSWSTAWLCCSFFPQKNQFLYLQLIVAVLYKTILFINRSFRPAIFPLETSAVYQEGDWMPMLSSQLLHFLCFYPCFFIPYNFPNAWLFLHDLIPNWQVCRCRPNSYTIMHRNPPTRPHCPKNIFSFFVTVHCYMMEASLRVILQCLCLVSLVEYFLQCNLSAHSWKFRRFP